MTTEYSGSGDPKRSMELLWGARKEPSRGPKPGIDLARIVRAAVELADAEGLAALSMRQVAARLGVGAMSLYTYVPGKAELLDLMLDLVLGEIVSGELGVPADANAEWRVKLETLARQDWALYQRHPWVLQIAAARAILGPNETALYEISLTAVAEVGLSGREMVAVVSLVRGYVRGAAQGVLEAALAGRQTGVNDDQWWAAREAIFDRYFDPALYPTMIAVERDGGFAPPADSDEYHLQRALADFEFGLQRVLDGIEAFIQRAVGER